MSVNLHIFFILLGSVLLSAEATTTVTEETTLDPLTTLPTDDPSSTTVNSEPTTASETHTDPATENSSEGVSPETAQSTDSNQTPDPDGGVQEGGSGLTPGEAAGVALGTIAGVAALGGGIFAGLKFSGKLG